MALDEGGLHSAAKVSKSTSRGRAAHQRRRGQDKAGGRLWTASQCHADREAARDNPCSTSRKKGGLTLPVPPSPTSTNLKVGTEFAAASAMVVCEAGKGKNGGCRRKCGCKNLMRAKTIHTVWRSAVSFRVKSCRCDGRWRRFLGPSRPSKKTTKRRGEIGPLAAGGGGKWEQKERKGSQREARGRGIGATYLRDAMRGW